MISWKPTHPFACQAEGFELNKGPDPVKAARAPSPVTERKTEVRQAQRQSRLLMNKRKGSIASTILAGEGNTNTSPLGTKSLLGGMG